MEWGEHIALLERAQRQGQPTALDTRPTLYADLEFYLDAFFFLSNSRAEGGGILVSEIIAYGELIKTHDLTEFVHTVKLIDNLYMRIASSKAKVTTNG